MSSQVLKDTRFQLLSHPFSGTDPSGNLIQRSIRPTVVPAETREDDRQVLLAFFSAPLHIFPPPLPRVIFDVLQGPVPAYGPRAYDVGLADNPVKCRVLHAIGIERPPSGRHTQQDREATVALVILEEVYQSLALGQRVL